MGRKRSRRKRMLVDRSMQLRFARLLALEVTVVSLILGAFLFCILRDQLRVMESLAPPGFIAVQKTIMPRLALQICLAMLINILLLTVAGVYALHEVAGPAYRLGEYMKAVGAGQLSLAATFRARDQLKTVAASFNEMMKGLREGVRKDIGRLDGARKALERVAHDPAIRGSEKAQQALAGIEKSLEELVERKEESLKAPDEEGPSKRG